MTALAWITALLLLVGFGMAGLAKLTKQKMVMQLADHLGFTGSQYQLIGAAEVAGAVGVLLGRLIDGWSVLGLAAAIGFTLLGIGALFFHVRAKDQVKDMVPISVLTLAAILHVIAIS